MTHETLIQSIMSTSYGAIAFYLGTGIVTLVVGFLFDSVLGPRHKAH
jgi:hypothetical protein